MARKMKFFGIFLLMSLQASAASVTIEDLVKNAPTASEYPNDDGLILLEKRVLVLDRQGTLTETYTRVFKILNQVGLSAYADPRFVYWAGEEKVKAIRARTFMADGTVVPVPQNGFHDMVWSAVASAPDWIDLHQFVINHTALEKGAVVDLEVRRDGPLQLRASGEVQLQAPFPILKHIFVVEMPKNQHFEYRSWPRPLTPDVTETDSTRIYRWVLENLPALPASQSWNRSLTPRGLTVAYSFVDWRTWVKKLRSRIALASRMDSVTLAGLHKTLSNVGRGITAVRATKTWVQENVRTVHLDPGLATIRIRPASKIYATRYATPLEKTVLLASALNNLGIPACVAVAGPEELVSPEKACPAALQSVRVAVDFAGKRLWIDPVSPSYEAYASLSGQRALVLGPEKYTWKLFSPGSASSNHLDLHLTLNLMPDQLEGEGVAVAQGLYAAGLILMSDAERERVLSDWVSSSLSPGNAKITQVRLVSDSTAELSFSFTLEDSLIRSRGFLILALTDSWPSLPGTSVPGRSPIRGAAFNLTAPFSVAERILLKFPRDWELVHLPGDWRVRNELGESKGNSDRGGTGEALILRQLVVEQRSIPADRVSAYLELLRGGSTLARRTVVFAGKTRKVRGKAPGVGINGPSHRRMFSRRR